MLPEVEAFGGSVVHVKVGGAHGTEVPRGAAMTALRFDTLCGVESATLDLGVVGCVGALRTVNGLGPGSVAGTANECRMNCWLGAAPDT
mmetsp:Transcript_72835/g.158100  ORF Transcript_72835/g.158100 Transcript_72835/m.158100 type:complete len:89 (+) Transcript_72835:198-464(+)